MPHRVPIDNVPRTNFWYAGLTKAQKDEIEALGLTAEMQLYVAGGDGVSWIVYQGKAAVTGAYSSEEAAIGRAEDMIARRGVDVLRSLHGVCVESHWHGRGGSTPCGRPAVGKGGGDLMCGPHLRGWERQQKNKEESLSAAAIEAADQAEAEAKVEVLRVKSGLPLSRPYRMGLGSRMGSYSKTHVEISIEQLAELLGVKL